MTFVYPPVSFFFEVHFEGRFRYFDERGAASVTNIVEMAFQSVTGLTVDLQAETLVEGGENRFEHVLPTRPKYGPLVLKRGLVKDSDVLKWCRTAIDDLDIQPMNLLINLLHIKGNTDSKSEPLMSWKVVNAWPRKWSVSEFDAEKSEIAIESLELNYQYFIAK